MSKNIDDLYPKRFLQSDQVDGDWELTIRECWVEEMKDFGGNEVNKLVLSFEEIDQQFPLTPTNAGRISALLGKDYEDYPGKTLLIGLEDGTGAAKGKKVIRIKQPIKVTKPQPRTVRPTGAALPQGEIDAANQAADEQVKF